jgi:hypothetical protein
MQAGRAALLLVFRDRNQLIDDPTRQLIRSSGVRVGSDTTRKRKHREGHRIIEIGHLLLSDRAWGDTLRM